MNNNLSNLEWTTSSGNRKHAWDMGLIKQTEGRIEAGFRRGMKRRKLTWWQAVEIRELHFKGGTQTNIAKKYGVDRKTVYMILNRITYEREG